MKISKFLSVLCFVFSTITVNAQQFQWVTGGGGNAPGPLSIDDQVKFMCTDANGNIYVASTVAQSSTVVRADTFFSNHSSNYGYLVTSYKCNGQMRWAKYIAADQGTTINAMALDDSGHLYVAGTLSSDTLFIGSDTTIPTYTYQFDGIIQLDTAGHFKWMRYTGNNSLVTAYGSPSSSGIVIDGSNKVHDLIYTNAGVPLMPGDTSLCGTYDMTYNSSGTLLSAVRLDLDSQWYIRSAVIDPASNKLYVLGSGLMGSWHSTTRGDTEWVAAFDASGGQIWWNTCTNCYNETIKIDRNKHLQFTNEQNGGAFSYLSDTIYNTHFGLGNTAIIMTIDTNGSPLWFKKFDGSVGGTTLKDITNVGNHHSAAAGEFAGTVIDDAGNTLTSGSVSTTGIYDPFFVVVDSAGDIQSMKEIYGDGINNGATAITSDSAGNIYIGGYVSDSIWAVNELPGGGSVAIPAYHSIGGNTDFFVMKYGIPCSCTAADAPVADYHDTALYVMGVEQDTITFNYNGTTSGIDSIVWNFGDPAYTGGAYGTGGVYTTTATHVYTLAGTYRPCAVVYTTCGSDIYCTNIVVPCLVNPAASYTTTTSVDLTTGTDSVGFTYTGTAPGLDSVVWDIAGSHATGISAEHTFTAMGTYTVCAIAYSECSSDSFCSVVNVPCLSIPTPASFSVAPTLAAITKMFTYTGSTTGIDSVVWHFGDGTTAEGNTATHAFADTGAYTVCVYAFTSCAEDSICNTVHVDSALALPLYAKLGKILISPNPLTDQNSILTITGDDLSGIVYKIRNEVGTIQYTGILKNGKNDINATALNSGIYFLELIDSDTEMRIVKTIVKE